MSNIVLQPNASGTGNITIATPNTNTDRTLNIPDVAGDLVTTGDTGSVTNAMLSGGHGGFRSMQVFSSSGSTTWTKPAGISFIKVYVTGGGGGAGGGAGNWNAGGGGCGGATAIKLIDVSSVSSVAVTVGIGGSGGSASADGNSGGTSSFGSYCSATGGEGGKRGGAGTNFAIGGGQATGGDLNIRGGMGQSSSGGGANDEPVAGHGGSSFWGGGVSQGAGNAGNVNMTGFAANVYGAGGGGGDDYSGTSYAGGNGAAGVVVVEEYA